MKLSQLLAVVGATVLLGALVSSAAARNFSVSSQTFAALWRRVDLSGTLSGTPVECELLLAGTLHTRTSTKTVNSLIGYITAATILRCARGSATIIQSSLPWHRRYRNFTGTLPNILTTSETVTGVEWNVREPGGATCRVRRDTSSTIVAYTVTGGAVTRSDLSGTSSCTETFVGLLFNGSLSGGETNIRTSPTNGVQITVTLI
jgi:hypothetical protein